MMKHLKTCCFLGLALPAADAPGPGRGAAAGGGAGAAPRGRSAFEGCGPLGREQLSGGALRHLEPPPKDVNTVLRRQTRGAVSVLLVAVLCGLVSGFQKGVGDESRFLPMAGGLAVTALTAGSLDSLMGAGTAVMEQMNTFSKALLPTLAAVSAISGGAVGATLRQIATVFFADLLLGLIHGLLMPMVYLYAGALAAGCCLADKRLTAVAELLKTVCTKLLTAALLAFTLYLTVGGIFAGTVDSARVRVTKTAISGMIPVVGGIIAEASETVLAGAGLLKGAIGVFGLLGVLALCAYPFLQLGIQYASLQADGFFGLRHRRYGAVRTDRRPWRRLRPDPGHGGKLRAGAAGVHSGLRSCGDIMMAAARAWLTAVVSVTLLLSVIQMLTPKGSLREITSFVGGLLLLAVLLRPLGSVDLSAVSLNLDAYRQTVEQRQAELEQEGQKELVGLIEAELESYISDKAADMGLDAPGASHRGAGRQQRSRPRPRFRGTDGTEVRSAVPVAGNGAGRPGGKTGVE
ncbi:MAG: stage III sporulation protein AE [Dysosmobacter sp.]